MASINWTHLSTQSPPSPLPLPQEKFIYNLSAVTLTLFPTPTSSSASSKSTDTPPSHTAKGSVYVSNQRIAFVATGVHAATPPGAGASTSKLETLSVPFAQFQDGRFVQPWFAATYYQALILPAPGGGLEVPHTLRLAFNEAGGYQFYEVVEEMKARLGTSGRTTANVEPLPLYTPPAPSTTAASTSARATPTPHEHVPSSDDLLAASVARAAEEEEAAPECRGGDGGEERARAVGRGAALDGPPGYEP